MKNIFGLLALSLISISSFANQNIDSDKQMEKYLTGYAKEAAQYQTCGEYDMVDIANVGIYFDEVVTPAYLKVLSKRYGSKDKAAMATVNRLDKMTKSEQKKLIAKGVPSGMCEKILNSHNE
jgi:uncharacterized protein with GYD domain